LFGFISKPCWIEGGIVPSQVIGGLNPGQSIPNPLLTRINKQGLNEVANPLITGCRVPTWVRTRGAAHIVGRGNPLPKFLKKGLNEVKEPSFYKKSCLYISIIYYLFDLSINL
jgi:hypothetical protein